MRDGLLSRVSLTDRSRSCVWWGELRNISIIPSPVRVSELISTFRVSRRTLHHAFDEVSSIPPITICGIAVYAKPAFA
jgi:hypothetical protein